MGRRLSEPEGAEIAAFTRRLYKWGGFARQKEWADASGFPATNLSKVMSGKAGLDGLNLIRLYQAAERRASTELPAAQAAEPEVHEILDRLLAAVRDLSRRLGREEADR